MRLKRLLAAWLSIALAAPPGAFAQSAAPDVLHPKANAVVERADAPLFETGSFNSSTTPPLPADIAPGVFGTYGGAESRFTGSIGPNPSLRGAPLLSQQLPHLRDRSGGSPTPP